MTEAAEELPLSWQDSLPHLLTAVHSEDATQMLHYTSHILQQTKDSSIPLDVLLTITKIHCRAFIQSKQYANVLDYCISLQETQQDMRRFLTLEECYALYKLGRYVKCRDVLLKRLPLDERDVENSLYLHLLAQCHYRLLETTKASESYLSLLQQPLDSEERMEVLINALAVKISNVTVCKSQDSKVLRLHELVEGQLEQVQRMRSGESVGEEEEEFDPSVYELMYNYGTLLLMTSNGLSQTQLARDLLECAEKECRSLHESNFEGEEEEAAVKNGELKSNLTPIQANLALAKLMTGDETEATRSYLGLILEARKEQAAAAKGGSNPGALFAAEMNLTVLQSRNASSSANDLLTRLPTTAGLETQGGGSATKSTITPNQIRTLLYNRALLYCRLKKTSECKTIFEGLTQSISPSADSNLLNGSASQTKKKRKKKMDAVLGADIRPAPPETEAERLLWKTRIAILNCELTRGGKKISSTGGNGIGEEWESLFQSAVKEVKDALKSEVDGSPNIAILEYALAELSLFGVQSKFPVGDEATKIEALEGLSSSIQSCPATVATLSALYKTVGKEDKVEELLDSALDSDMARKSLADFKLNLGLYEEAAEIYESIIEGDSGAKLTESEMMECKAALVKALSYFDIEAAVALASELTLNEDISNADVDGEELEAMNVPRLSKGPGKGSSRIQKMIGAHGKNNEEQKKKQNRDAILRKRARRREAYLEKLQKEGRYNPDRPVQPDPERWIPKTQRSYTKRGRRGRNKFVGAQGGGTGAGAEKDAAKLDVAARAAARAEGKESGNQQPSTAHMSVSSKGKGGRRR